MHPLALLNTSILTTDGTYHCFTIDVDTALHLLREHGFVVESYIGHEATAQILSQLFPIPIMVDRRPFLQQVGQTALVFKLNGRIPEGSILSQAEIARLGYELKILVRLA